MAVINIENDIFNNINIFIISKDDDLIIAFIIKFEINLNIFIILNS